MTPEQMHVMSFSKESLEKFTREFERLFDDRDASSMASYYAEDAHLMAEGLTPILGKGLIREFWQSAIDRAREARARRTIQLHDASCSGSLGYALCTVTVEFPRQEPGSEPARITSWDTTVWRRSDGGEWHMVVDISAHTPG
jgi:ketosteroid isomerase-like protein